MEQTNRSRPVFLLIVLGALMVVPVKNWGTTYYVRPDGLDSNPGTAAKPWKTISRAAAMLRAGDTVSVAAGTYRERIEPQSSGLPGQPITYRAAAAGTVILDGRRIELPDDLAGIFEISRKSWIVVEGFRVINAGPHRDNAGIMVNESGDITINGCQTADTTSSGIGVWGSRRVTVDGCQVERAGAGGYQESITVAGTEGFEVRGCRVSDCRKEGICLKDGSSSGVARGNDVQGAHSVGIYVDAWDKRTHDIEVVGNRVHDNDGNGIALASEMGGVLERVSVHDNLCYANRYLGIHVSTNGDSSVHPMRDLFIVNNTCAANGWEDWGGGIALDNPGAQGVLIRNNICSANRYFQLVVGLEVGRVTAAIDHNFIDGFGGTEGEMLGEAAVQGDPLFAGAARGDFHLRPGSPAIDAGSADRAPSADFEGNPRPRDGNGDGAAVFDMGAFEL